MTFAGRAGSVARMLAKIPYLVGVEYVPPGKRRPRHEYFRDEESFDIPEMDGSERAAYAIRSTGEWPTPPTEAPILSWDGRLYWPVTDQHLERTWTLEQWLAHAGDALFVENPGAYPCGDVLDVRAMLEESRRRVAERPDDPRYSNRMLRMDWTRSLSELDARAKVLQTTHDVARAHLGRAAASLALKDGTLYRAGGEPVLAISGTEWPTLHVLDASAVEAWRPSMPSWRNSDGGRAFPFVDYDLFRADRYADAVRKVAEFERHGHEFGPLSRTVEPLGPHAPSFDATTLVLSRASEILRAAIAHERRLAGLTAPGIAAVDRIHERRAELLEGLPDPAAATDRSAWASIFKEVSVRLKEVSVNMLTDGAAHRRLSHMLEQAHLRAVRDRDAGLIALPGLAASDEDAIGRLAP